MTDNERPPGTVFYQRGRWWRASDQRGERRDNQLQDLIVPRKHDDNMFTNGGLTSDARYMINMRLCAWEGCPLCKSMIAERNHKKRPAPTPHAYDRTPTKKHPVVRYGQFRQPPDETKEFVRDDGTDNLVSVIE